MRKDPASTSPGAAAMHQGLHALWLHAASHALHRRGKLAPARALAYVGRVLTGIDAHPAARIGPGVFIDHGSGVVIGETAVLEPGVMLYHNVTIGAAGWWLAPIEGGRRHPVVQANTIVGTGALILGPITVGPDCVIGAHAIVLADVPAGTRIRAGEVWRGAKEQGPLARLLSERRDARPARHDH